MLMALLKKRIFFNVYRSVYDNLDSEKMNF